MRPVSTIILISVLVLFPVAGCSDKKNTQIVELINKAGNARDQGAQSIAALELQQLAPESVRVAKHEFESLSVPAKLAAMKLFTHFPDPEINRILISTLSSNEPNLVVKALNSTQRLNISDALPKAIELSKSEDSDVQNNAIYFLIAFMPDMFAEQQLINLAKSLSPNIRELITDGLEKSRSTESRDCLESLLNDSNEYVRLYAIRALSNREPESQTSKSLAKYVIECLNTPGTKYKLFALKFLIETRTPNTRMLAQRLLLDSDLDVQIQAAKTLRENEYLNVDPKFVEPLLVSKEDQLVDEALQLVGRRHVLVSERLVLKYCNGTVTPRLRMAAVALALVGTISSERTLRRLSSSDDRLIRECGCAGLERLGLPNPQLAKVQHELTRDAHNKMWTQRIWAKTSLELFSGTWAKELLNVLENDSDPFVRE